MNLWFSIFLLRFRVGNKSPAFDFLQKLLVFFYIVTDFLSLDFFNVLLVTNWKLFGRSLVVISTKMWATYCFFHIQFSGWAWNGQNLFFGYLGFDRRNISALFGGVVIFFLYWLKHKVNIFMYRLENKMKITKENHGKIDKRDSVKKKEIVERKKMKKWGVLSVYSKVIFFERNRASNAKNKFQQSS